MESLLVNASRKQVGEIDPMSNVDSAFIKVKFIVVQSI